MTPGKCAAPHTATSCTGQLSGGSWLEGGHRDPRLGYTAWAGCTMSAALTGFFVIDTPPRPRIVPADGTAPRHHDGSHGGSAAGLGLALASHNSWMPPPSCWSANSCGGNGFGREEAEDILHYPDLQPGDLLLAAGALSYAYATCSSSSSDGSSKSMVVAVPLIYRGMRPSDPDAGLATADEAAGPAPEWMAELSLTQVCEERHSTDISDR